MSHQFLRAAAGLALSLISAGAAAHDDRDQGYGYGQVVRCESRDRRTHYCDVDTRGGVRLVRQYSDSPCVRGRTWGYDRRGLWVSGGCRGEFALDGGWGGDWDDDYGHGGHGRTIRCESRDGRSHYCRADTRGGVRLVRQYSDSPCVRGRSWNYDRGGIRVDRGCRAEFALGDGWGGGWDDNPRPPGYGQTLRCESRDGRYRMCALPWGGRRVTLTRQLSETRCIEGQTWGVNRQGVWVDRGCRGEFASY